jgi:hypothetical protein
MMTTPVIDSGVFSGEYQTPVKPYKIRKDHLCRILGSAVARITLVGALSIGFVAETGAASVEPVPTSAMDVRPAAIPTSAYPRVREASVSHASWLAAAKDRLKTFEHLDVGWDGYKAGPVSRDVVGRAAQVLEWSAIPGVYEPALVPTAAGAVQIEWQPTDGHSLELYVPASGPLSAYYVHEASDVEEEEVDVDQRGVRDLVGRLVAAI